MEFRAKNFLSLIIFCFFYILNSHWVMAKDIDLGFLTPKAYSDKFQQTIKLEVGDFIYNLSPDEIEKWIFSHEDLSYDPNYFSEIENNLCYYYQSPVCEITVPFRYKNHSTKISRVAIAEEPVLNFLSDIARQVNKEPINAKLQMDEGKVSVFSLSSNGLELEKEKSLKTIIDYLLKKEKSEKIQLAYREIKPDISIDSIDNLGITSLIGEGKSNFRGSPKNRIFNIKVATNRFNGILIKPGEEFSFTKILGEVDAEHGYLPELVIKKDKTEPEFGGGICQVSTTAFRAAIYSGLKITARRNHAYPVQYYNPQGMDATVYVPRPDLRFINDTPAHILIQTKIEGTELIFQFYGTDDGRKTEVIGPRIFDRKPDGSMKATFTQKVMDKNGEVLREDIFNSSYDSPSKYPHPGETLTQKPSGWSDNEWKKYKRDHNLQ